VEHTLVSDTTGKNALYKIHVALGKIVNNLDARDVTAVAPAVGGRVGSRSVSVAAVKEEDKTVVEDRTVVPDVDIKEEEVDEVEEEVEDEGASVAETSVADDITVVTQVGEESLVDDLLDDDGDTEMGM